MSGTPIRPRASATDAMRYWPETATAVAVRRHGAGLCETAAPLGFDDLFGLILRPTSNFAVLKRDVYDERLRSKKWLKLCHCCGKHSPLSAR